MGETVYCQTCHNDATDEAHSALGDMQFGGYNPMSIQYAEPWPAARVKEFLQTYVCRTCAANTSCGSFERILQEHHYSDGSREMEWEQIVLKNHNLFTAHLLTAVLFGPIAVWIGTALALGAFSAGGVWILAGLFTALATLVAPIGIFYLVWATPWSVTLSKDIAIRRLTGVQRYPLNAVERVGFRSEKTRHLVHLGGLPVPLVSNNLMMELRLAGAPFASVEVKLMDPSDGRHVAEFFEERGLREVLQNPS